MKDEKIKVHVVSHSHWDREWYVPLEIYRNRLNVLIEKLIEEFDKDSDFKHFTLDGQTIIIEDYFERYPQKAAEIKKYVEDGRLEVGPWYILPDEFLIQGETFIRNYTVGQSVLEKYGMKSSKAGYLPDMFGHTAYTPELLKGLGMKAAVLWRGPGKSCRKTEFIWESETGECIPVVHLRNSYSNAANFGLYTEALTEKICVEIKNISEHRTSENVLLMNGTDHEFPIFEIVDKFKEISSNTGTEVIHSSIGKYIEDVTKETGQLEIIKGELRDSTYEHTLKDVLSSRIYLKLLSFEAQQLFIKYVEPLSATVFMNGKRGKEYLENEILSGWKLILQSLTHDGICGCSTDRVQRKVEDRFIDAIYFGSSLIGKYMRDLFTSEDEIVYGDNYSIMVFNPDDKKEKKIVETRIPRINFSNYALFDENGYEVEFEIREEISSMNSLYETRWHRDISTISEFQSRICPHKVMELYSQLITFKSEIPCLGFAKYELRKRETNKDLFSRMVLDPFEKYDNGIIEFKLNRDSSFNLKDKRNRREYFNLNKIYDIADLGDEYNFSYAQNDIPLTVEPEMLKSVEVVKTVYGREYTVTVEIPISAEYDYQKNVRSVNKIANFYTVKYRVFDDSERIDVEITLDNKSKDHKTYFEIKVPEKIEYVLKDSYYGLVKHPVNLYEYDETMTEENISRYAMESLSAIKNDNCGIMVVSRGINEFETGYDEGNTVGKYTVLRSVGMLSKDNLKTRKGEAGPLLLTPEGQCICEIIHNYSIIPLNRADDSDLYEKAGEYLFKTVAICGKTSVKSNDFAYLGFESDKNVFLKSMKIAEKTYGVNLRFMNISSEKTKIHLKNDNIESCFQTDLVENEVDKCDADRLVVNIDRINSYNIEFC